jgi:uncharacterized membrane protein YciS (DUF1049 family)
MIRGVVLMVAAFLAVTLVAVALGAPNTGQAMTYGQLAFAATAVALIARAR